MQLSILRMQQISARIWKTAIPNEEKEGFYQSYISSAPTALECYFLAVRQQQLTYYPLLNNEYELSTAYHLHLLSSHSWLHQAYNRQLHIKYQDLNCSASTALNAQEFVLMLQTADYLLMQNSTGIQHHISNMPFGLLHPSESQLFLCTVKSTMM